MPISRVLIAEPIYQALEPLVYGNRIKFWKNVFIAEYVTEQLFAEFGVVSSTAVSYDPNSLIMGPRRNIRSARATAIKMAREKKASHILFLDDDVLVPPDILDILLKVDKDIVGGLMHKDDGNPIVFKTELSEDGLEEYWTDHPKDTPFQCGGVGAGCMLIKMGVFERLDVVWPSNHWYFNYDETGRSMDLRFCRRAMLAGSEVWCVPDPPCQQLAHY